MIKFKVIKLAVVGLLFCSLAAQAQIIYQVDRTVGAGTIKGFIETDGTTGPLDRSHIRSWSFDANDGTDVISISSASGGFLQGTGWSYLSATDSELLFDFDGVLADPNPSVEGISFHGQDNPQTYSFDYNLLGNFLGKLEQLVHQFGTSGGHHTESPRTGVVVIGTTGNGNAGQSPVVHSVHIGGPDICEAFGLKPGCDANYSGSAVLRANGRVTGQFIDTFAAGGAGVHATIDCLHVAGNDAWLSGFIKHGSSPGGFDFTGLPIILRVRDNGVSAHDPDDAVSYSRIGNPTPCYMEPDLGLIDYVHGQVQIR